MNITCSAEVCPVILSSTCVFYRGASLIYTGINSGDNLETALQKIDAKFEDAGLGYVFNNGVIQTTPGQPVGLGGSLIANTTIGGNYTLTFSGNLQATKLITTGGTSSQFVKGDGTLDNIPYQPAGNYITALTGDGTASGPGSSVLTLATVNIDPATYGSATQVPVITVNAKGLVTNITPTLIYIPSDILVFGGDVYGTGYTGSLTNLTLSTVNSTTGVFGSSTQVPVITVNGKGLITNVSLATITGGGGGGSQNLQQVTNVGNTTTDDVNVNSLGIWDPISEGYGNLSFADGIFNAKNNINQFIFSVENSGLYFYNGAYQAQITSGLLTATRNYELPNLSGRIPLSVNGNTADTSGAITISVGSTQNLQQVTDEGNSTTNSVLIGTSTDDGSGAKLQVNGKITVSSDSLINGLTVGKGSGNIVTNTVVGFSALAANTTGTNTIAIGYNALKVNTTGDVNLAIGRNSLFNNTSGGSNVAIGYTALQANTSGGGNTAVGTQAGTKNTTANSNAFFGFSAGFNTTTGASNTMIGANAGLTNTTGTQNVFVGTNAGNFNTTGIENTFIGTNAGYTNITSNSNVFVGKNAGYYTTSGSGNTFTGQTAGLNNTTGATNVFVGQSAATNNTTGSNNVILGVSAAAYTSSTGTSALATIIDTSIIIGANTTLLGNSQSNQIVIGNGAIGSGSNTTTIGNRFTTNSFILGNLNIGSLVGTSAGTPLGVSSITGGTLPAATYYYQIVTVDANGNTTGPSIESLGVTTTGTTSSVSLSWTAVTGAASYRIYRGTTSLGENVYYTSATNSYIDINDTSTAGVVPTTNTTYISRINSTDGYVFATGYKIPGGTSSQFLTADGGYSTGGGSGGGGFEMNFMLMGA